MHILISMNIFEHILIGNASFFFFYNCANDINNAGNSGNIINFDASGPMRVYVVIINNIAIITRCIY